MTQYMKSPPDHIILELERRRKAAELTRQNRTTTPGLKQMKAATSYSSLSELLQTIEERAKSRRDCAIHPETNTYSNGQCPDCIREEEERKKLAIWNNPSPEMVKAGVPEKYIRERWTLEELGLSEKMKAGLYRYAENLHVSILYCGVTGCGKTTLAVCVLREVVRLGKPALFVSVSDFLMELREAYEGNWPVTKKISTIKKTPFLVLDDLAAHGYSDKDLDYLYSIIDHRINYMLPTIVTTNLDFESIKPGRPGELERVLGARTASRLASFWRPKLARVDYRKGER